MRPTAPLTGTESSETGNEAVEGVSHLAETRQGISVHALTLAVTLQTHGSVGKFPHVPGRDRLSVSTLN